MKIFILTIGKLKPTEPVALLIKDYVKQMKWKVEIKEFDPIVLKDLSAAKAGESELLLSSIKKDSYTIAIDPRGSMLDSHEIAEHISSCKAKGVSSITFILGGPNGLSQELIRGTSFQLSLGKITLSHKLARLVIVDQLNKAWALLISR